MPVPKRKTSKARRDSRSSGKKIKSVCIVVCQTCQAPILPHQVCKECGHYKGVKVLRTKSERAYERGQARQAKEKQNKVEQQPDNQSKSQ